MEALEFEVDEIVEMVRGQAEIDFRTNLMRRYFRDESTVQEMVDLVDHQDGDLYKVCEIWPKTERRTSHLFLCESLKTQEKTLFGPSGLRKTHRGSLEGV